MSDSKHGSDGNSIEVTELEPAIKREQSTLNLNDDRKYVQLKKVSGITIFEEFLGKCMEVVKSVDDISRAVEKIRKRFDEVDPLYKDSQSFISFLQKIIPKVITEPWQCMKSVADLLKDNSVTKMKKLSTDSTAVVRDQPINVMNKRTERFMWKLESTLTKLLKKIQTLEQNDVNFDESDDENSNYIKVSRYKKRFCQVFNKVRELQKIAKDESSSSVIRFSGTKIPSVNRAIERFYNDKKEFPDFHDILNVVLVVNNRKNLGLSQAKIHETAKIAFEELGQTLKLQRQYEFHDVMCTYLPVEENDPALMDDTLEQKLAENKRLYGHKIDEIINKYAIQQEKDHLEPVEVGSGKESSISESEEEDENLSVVSVSECEDLAEFTRENNQENESDVESLSDEDRSFPVCSVELYDVTKLPIWERYRKSIVTQVDLHELNNPCCSKSLISSTISRKRGESETDSDDSDASEPKRRKFMECQKAVSSHFSSDFKDSERNITGKTDELEVVGTGETKSTECETSDSNHSKQMDAFSFLEESSMRVRNNVTNRFPKNDQFTTSVDCQIQPSKCAPNESATESELIVPNSDDIKITSGIPFEDTHNFDDKHRDGIAERAGDQVKNDVMVNVNSGRCNSLLLNELKTRSVDNSELPLKSVTRCKPNVNLNSVTAANNFYSECVPKNVPNGVSSTIKTKYNDDDIVILDEFPSSNKPSKIVSSANEIIDVDKLENNTKLSRINRPPAIELSSSLKHMNRKPPNLDNRLSTSGRITNTNLCVRPQSNSSRPSLDIQRWRRINPQPECRSRPGQSVCSNTNRAQIQPERRANHQVHQQRVQFNQTLHKRTTQTDEIRFVQNNYEFAAKRTTMVEESVLRMSAPRFSPASHGGFSTPLRDYNSPNSTLRSSRGLRRVTQCTTQRTRVNISADEIVTLD